MCMYVVGSEVREPVVGKPVGASVGVSELNSAALVGANVGNEVRANITSSKLCACREGNIYCR